MNATQHLTVLARISPNWS